MAKAKSSKTSRQMRGAEYPAETVKIPDTENYSVRKIGNGWIMGCSGHRNGKYFSEETYCREKPKITANDGMQKGK